MVAYIVCDLEDSLSFCFCSAFRLGVLQSHARARPQTFRHIPIETNDLRGRKHDPQKYIAILLYSSTSRGIQSQPTHIVAQDTFLIF